MIGLELPEHSTDPTQSKITFTHMVGEPQRPSWLEWVRRRIGFMRTAPPKHVGEITVPYTGTIIGYRIVGAVFNETPWARWDVYSRRAHEGIYPWYGIMEGDANISIVPGDVLVFCCSVEEYAQPGWMTRIELTVARGDD